MCYEGNVYFISCDQSKLLYIMIHRPYIPRYILGRTRTYPGVTIIMGTRHAGGRVLPQPHSRDDYNGLQVLRKVRYLLRDAVI